MYKVMIVGPVHLSEADPYRPAFAECGSNRGRGRASGRGAAEPAKGPVRRDGWRTTPGFRIKQ